MGGILLPNMVGPILIRHPTPELLKQDMIDVLAEFYRLDEIINDTSQHLQNYVVIRLVTIIEQFFRKIVEKKIKGDKLGKYVPDQLKLDKQTFINIESITKEILISSSYSFQNVSEIQKVMRQFGIQNAFSSSRDNVEEEFKKLFQSRHNTVHSIVSSDLENKIYYQLTEDLIENILVRVYDQKDVFVVFKGDALTKLSRYEKAVRCYNKGLELNPNNSHTHVRKGFSLARLNRHEDAIRCYDRALHLGQKSDIMNEKVYTNKGFSLARLNRHEDAIRCYDEQIKISPEDAYAYFCKGLSLDFMNMPEKAIKCYDEQIKISPEGTYAYVGKGFSLLRLGLPEKAAECFSRALKSGPSDGYVYAGQGFVFEQLGRHKEANKWFERARQADSTVRDLLDSI